MGLPNGHTYTPEELKALNPHTPPRMANPYNLPPGAPRVSRQLRSTQVVPQNDVAPPTNEVLTDELPLGSPTLIREENVVFPRTLTY